MTFNRKKLIKQIENSVPVFDWEYLGVKIWPMIRIILSFEILEKTKPRTKDKIHEEKVRSLIRRILAPFKIFLSKLKDSKHNRVNPDSKIVLLGRSTLRNTKIEGKWVDPIIDSFKYYLELLNEPPLHLEFDSLNITRIPRFSSSLLIHNSISFCKIKAYIKLYLNRDLPIKLPGFKKFVEILTSNNLDLSVTDRNKVKYFAQVLRYRADFFKKILKKYQIQLGFCTVYYIPEGLAFILACNEMNIPSIDIQHGVQGDYHIAYSDWNNAEIYNLLPKFFWVWSQYEKTNIQKWSGKYREKVFVGGNLWLKFWMDNTNRNINPLQKELQKLIIDSSKETHILFSAQPNDTFESIIPLIKESPTTWFWWIRLHPRMLEQESQIKKILELNKISNYCIREASHFPLPILLSTLDFHVTYNSTVVIEAEFFNMHSLLLAKNGIEIFPEQFKRGIACFEEEIPDSIHCIQRIIEKKKQNKSHNDNEEEKPAETLKTFLEILDYSE